MAKTFGNERTTTYFAHVFSHQNRVNDRVRYEARRTLREFAIRGVQLDAIGRLEQPRTRREFVIVYDEAELIATLSGD